MAYLQIVHQTQLTLVQKISYTFYSQLTITGLLYDIQKKVNCDVYKFVILILPCGIPHLHSFYDDMIVKLYWVIW